MNDIFYGKKGGKMSSKRVWGSVLLTAAVVMTILGGLGWYNPVESLVETMFYTGGALLGIGVFGKSGKK